MAGASGVLGQPALRELQAAGHTVVGLARSDTAAAIIHGLGAEVARGDVLDLETVTAAAAGTDAIVNLTGALPARRASAGRAGTI